MLLCVCGWKEQNSAHPLAGGVHCSVHEGIPGYEFRDTARSACQIARQHSEVLEEIMDWASKPDAVVLLMP
jgi:hypothetical protein